MCSISYTNIDNLIVFAWYKVLKDWVSRLMNFM